MKPLEHYLPSSPTIAIRELQSCYGPNLQHIGRQGALYTIMVISAALLLQEDVATAQQGLIRIAQGCFPSFLDWNLESLSKSNPKELQGLLLAIASLLAEGIYDQPMDPIVRDQYPHQFQANAAKTH